MFVDERVDDGVWDGGTFVVWGAGDFSAGNLFDLYGRVDDSLVDFRVGLGINYCQSNKESCFGNSYFICFVGGVLFRDRGDFMGCV